MPSTQSIGFSGGFTTGLVNGINANRQRKDAEEEKKQKHALSAIDFLMNSGQVEDIEHLQPLLAVGLPDIFGEAAEKARGKNGQKGPDGQAIVKNVLAQALQGQKGTPLSPGPAAVQPPAAPMPSIGEGPIPVSGEGAAPLPSRTVGDLPSPTPPRHSLAGVPLLSPDEAMQHGLDRKAKTTEADITTKVALARRMLPALQAVDPTMTLQGALKMVGLDTLNASLAARAPQTGTFGDFILRRESELGHRLSADETEQARKDFAVAGSVQSAGVNRESLAMSTFGKRFSELTPTEGQEILTKEKALLEGQAAARATGTGKGKMDAPADFTTARENGVAVGTTPNDVLNQGVATQADRELRRSTESLKTDLTHIKDQLLNVLPSETDPGFAGLAPGIAFAIRKRDPRWRVPIARLDSAMNGIVNAVARSVAQQKGAQTEADAKRAESAIVSLRDSWTQGDTRESAAARIEETMRIVDELLAKMPSAPVAAPKTSKTSTGLKMDASGNIVGPNGQVIIPVK